MGHYLIGTVLGVVYVFGARAVGVSAGSFLVALVYGFATNVFPWLLMFPALGFGVCGHRSPPGRNLFVASLMNHLYYGLGLWWAARLLGVA